MANILLSLRYNKHDFMTNGMLDHNLALKSFVIEAYNTFDPQNPHKAPFGFKKGGARQTNHYISNSFINILINSR